MKLTATSYTSPKPTQGTFENVTIEDYSLTHKRHDKYISIGFDMYYMNGEEKVSLDKVEMAFLGMEDDEVSTNRTTTIRIPNPDFDAEVEGSEEKIIVSLFGYLAENEGVMPTEYEMVDYGYPTYEKVMSYFSGGTLTDPEIRITSPLAIGFLLNSLVMNGELVSEQFGMV